MRHIFQPSPEEHEETEAQNDQFPARPITRHGSPEAAKALLGSLSPCGAVRSGALDLPGRSRARASGPGTGLDTVVRTFGATDQNSGPARPPCLINFVVRTYCRETGSVVCFRDPVRRAPETPFEQVLEFVRARLCSGSTTATMTKIKPAHVDPKTKGLFIVFLSVAIDGASRRSCVGAVRAKFALAPCAAQTAHTFWLPFCIFRRSSAGHEPGHPDPTLP